MKKIKFALISSDLYPPKRVDMSVLFCREIVNRGHRVDFYLQSEEDCDQNYIVNSENAVYYISKTDNGINKICRIKKHIYSILNDLKVISNVFKNKYDFVQVKDKFLTAFLVLPICIITKTKFIYWLSFPFPEQLIHEYHEGTARYPYIYLIRGYLQKYVLYQFICKLSDHIFVQSEQMKRDLCAEGVNPDIMTAIPMGFCEQDFNEFNSRYSNVQMDFTKIVYLGTLNRIRKIDFLIRVLALVLKSCPKVKLYLIGDGDDPEDIRLINNEADNLMISQNIVLTGYLDRNRAFKHVKESVVCLSPFFPTAILNSTSPTKLIEYMALGSPVIANDHPEQNEIIKNSEGGICTKYIEEEFADAIVSIILNPKEREKMSEKGRQYVFKNRSYSKICDKLENAYISILGYDK